MNQRVAKSWTKLTTLATVLSLFIATEGYADLLLGYSFDDQDDPTSNSGTLGPTYNGDLQGNATYAPFGSGFALSLDGNISNDSVVVPLGNASAFDIGDADFSLFARFQTSFTDTSSANLRGLIWKTEIGNNPSFSLGVRQNDGLAQFGLADGTQWVLATSNAALNDGATHTLLAIRQGNLLGLFVDGVLESTSTIPEGFGSTSNNEALVVGGRIQNIGSNDDWVGLIDEVQIHDSAVMNIPEPSGYLFSGICVWGAINCRRRRNQLIDGLPSTGLGN